MGNGVNIKNLSFQYPNMKEPILKNISLKIDRGECVLLCGKSGSGKTTLTRILNGLSPSFFQGNLQGECSVFGVKAGESAIEDYVPVVGSVFQNPKTQYFNVNTTAELVFPCENAGYRQEEIRERLEETAGHFSIGHLLDRNIFKLSGGEKQRIAFGAACMLRPKLLVLDEPTSNLDQEAIEDFRKLIIEEKKRGTTIVIAEHRLAWTMDFADRYVYFENGEIANEWSNQEFRKLSQNELERKGLRVTDLQKTKEILRRKLCDEKREERSRLLVKLENLEIGYDKKSPIYTIKELSINKGEILGIMGHNGVGKSTFAKTLCGLIKPINGCVMWNGQKVQKKKLLKKCFLVMQDVNYQLFSDSVREEVLIGTKNDEDCDHVLNDLDILEHSQAHPMSLSGGQKQRVAIASAVLAGKELIILDEPTSGLDHYHMSQVGRLLNELKEKGKAIVVITHDEELAAGWCDQIVYLQGGGNYGVE